jgi:hypothetical protein
MSGAVKPILAVVGAVASLAAGAGIGAYVVHGRDTNRTNQISSIKAADAAQLAKLTTRVTAGARSDGSHYGSLFAYLLPMPAGWSAGPEVGTSGNNNYIGAAQINAEVQSSLLNVPKSDMSSTENTLADLHLQGVAVRSMLRSDDSLQLDFTLLQLDPTQASADQKSLGVLVDGLGFRQGRTGTSRRSCRRRARRRWISTPRFRWSRSSWTGSSPTKR